MTPSVASRLNRTHRPALLIVLPLVAWTCLPDEIRFVDGEGGGAAGDVGTSGRGGDTASGGLGGSGGNSEGGSGKGGTAGEPGTAGSGSCEEQVFDQEVRGPLDIYFVFDRSASMGEDCAYQAGSSPPVNSKACFATYALADYLTSVTAPVDTRLAFQFMPTSMCDDCDGTSYLPPLVELTTLPATADHALIRTISDETFVGGCGTPIEGALRGVAQFTAVNRAPGREMAGLLMTDGDPNGCETDIDALSGILSGHLANTSIRTFIIGMEGATDSSLELLGSAGGATPHTDGCGSISPPCHFWNVADGSGTAVADAFQAIAQQAAPLRCEFDIPLVDAELLARDDITLKFLSGPTGFEQTWTRVSNLDSCTATRFYFDDAADPTKIIVCPEACAAMAQAPDPALDVVFGCREMRP